MTATEDIGSRAHVNELKHDKGVVTIKYAIAPETEHGHEITLKSYEAPAHSFGQALDRLCKYAVSVMDFEETEKWKRGLNVTGLKIAYKNGKRYCQFYCKRQLDCGLSAEIKTPPILIVSHEEKVIQLGELAYDDIEAMLAEAQGRTYCMDSCRMPCHEALAE